MLSCYALLLGFIYFKIKAGNLLYQLPSQGKIIKIKINQGHECRSDFNPPFIITRTQHLYIQNNRLKTLMMDKPKQILIHTHIIK